MTTDLTIYFIIVMGLIFIFGIAIMVNQKHILERYENDYQIYLNYLRETQGWVFEHIDQSAKNADRIINRLDNMSYDLDKILNKMNIASDRGKNDEEMFDYRDLVEKGFAIELPEQQKSSNEEDYDIDGLNHAFHVGEWITNGDYTWKIVGVKPLDYILQSQDGNIVDDTISYVDEHFHLWSIQDAKDGDVLVDGSCIFIIQKLGDNSTAAKTYCTLHNDGDFDNGSILYFDIDSTKPATKSQRDLLFQKMKEAGYEWDSEKKELKKIETKTLDADDILPYLGNNQVQDILEDMGMLDDNGRCPHTAEEIFKAGMEHAFNLNRESA